MNTPETTMRGYCQHCGKPLDPIEVEINGRMTIVAYRVCGCPKAVEEVIEATKAEAERVAREERAAVERRYRYAGIPPKYWDACADDADHVEKIKAGQGLFFTGKSGRGKTYTACSIARKLIAEGWRVRFGDVETIEREVKAAWHARDTSEAEVILKYANADLAIIDDLGAEAMTPTTMKVLRGIITEREANGGVTIFTSNFDRKGFARHIAENADQTMAYRLASRIAGMTELVEFDGEDRRLAR